MYSHYKTPSCGVVLADDFSLSQTVASLIISPLSQLERGCGRNWEVGGWP